MMIRPAVPQDGPAFLALVRALADFEHLPPPDPAACERLLDHAFGDPPLFELWVGELPLGRVAAYAVTFTTYSTFLARPTLFLEDLFVQPAARNRGLGTAFLDFLKELAIQRQCGRFEWTVLDWNRDAQRFYERMGARIMKEWQICRIVLE